MVAPINAMLPATDGFHTRIAGAGRCVTVAHRADARFAAAETIGSEWADTHPRC